MEKGNLAKWLKKEGDKVKSGDVIAEIETDKATMEVEAVDEGTIAKILVPEGTQDVPVNDIIAVLAGDGEDVKSAGAGAASAPKAAPAPAATPAAAAPAPRRHRLRSLLHLPPHLRRNPPHQPSKPMATPASSRRHWPGVWPRKPASSWHGSTAPARMAASSRATSKGPNPARG
jgi:pyruvate dehydrogenase E2 component (dihydrolipoamide acetyltransferase)